MNKTEIAKMMQAETKSCFITRQKLADLMGIKCPRNVDKYLRGLEKIDGKYYFIPDVAQVLKDRC